MSPGQSFDRAAAGYHRHAGVQRALADWVAEWLPTDRAGRALEIGAGPGVLTRHLIPWSGRLVATDLSPAMCAAGRLAIPQVEWREMAGETPLPGPWDWIFSSAMLQWTASPETIFSVWRDRLAPGGRILAGLFVAGSLPEWSAVTGGLSPLVWRTPEAWCAALARSGLRLTRQETQTKVFIHPTALAWLRALHGAGAAPTQRTPPGRLRRWLRDYETHFRAPGIAGVQATWVFFRFEAERPVDKGMMPALQFVG
jgi:malonyl-CoA O-methyltransferase